MTHDKKVISQWIDSVIADGRGLTSWEEDFIDSIAEQFAERGSISDRQEEILEKIYSEKT